MTTTTTPDRADTGWCDQRDTHNGAFDHDRWPSCINFVSDAEHTAQLTRDAAEYDARATFVYPSGATTTEAAYVEQVIGR